MSENTTFFLCQAIELAAKNVQNHQGGPFGAVVVCNGEIVGEGVNSVTTTPDVTAHAEINALRAACKRLGRVNLSDCELYSSCEPCPMCLSAIYWARISTVYYAATRHDAATAGFIDDHIYEELTLPPMRRSVSMVQIDEPAARKILQDWQYDSKNTHY